MLASATAVARYPTRSCRTRDARPRSCRTHDFESDTAKVTVSSDGQAIIDRKDEGVDMLYVGLKAGDSCTAALLFNLIPVPCG